MKKVQRNIVTVYEFGGGRWEVARPHMCSSCGLTKNEKAAIEAMMAGIERCLPVMEQMEARITELENFLAQGNIAVE